jgi:alkylation response protein AidB-like acyl-CoA dehydrogenase
VTGVDRVGRIDATLDETTVDVQLGGPELEMRARVREVVRREVAPRARELDRHGSFAHDSYQALARAGLGGLLFPTELGGSASSTVGYAVAMEEIAAACGATSLVYMTQTHAAYPIALAGEPELVRRWVPALCSGAAYGSLAITEPGAGSDVSGLRTTARRDGDHYVLDGSKTFITTGDRADVAVVFATTDRAAGRGAVSAFVVERSVAGLTRGRPLQKMGMHGSSTAELFFDGVRVPACARLGEEGSGWRIVMKSVVKSRVSAAAQGVGLARGAYAHALAALTANGPVDREVGARLAELRARLLQGRLLLHATARAIDAASHDDPLTAEVAMMKLACTDLGMEVALAATDLLGPLGDLWDVGVERYVRDAKVTQIYDGTNEIQRLLISRDTGRRLEGVQ